MRLVSAFVLGLGIVFASSAAEAGKRVDWSDYIEAPGARTPVAAAAPAPSKADSEKPAKRAKVSKRHAKGKRSAVKARAKKRARK